MSILCMFGKHRWDGCYCTKCGVDRHDWELVGSTSTKYETDGFFLNGFGQCGPTEIITYYDEYKCKTCGATREEEAGVEER